MRAILRAALDWACFFTLIIVEIMSTYGLEDGLHEVLEDRQNLLLKAYVFEWNYAISLR